MESVQSQGNSSDDGTESGMEWNRDKMLLLSNSSTKAPCKKNTI